ANAVGEFRRSVDDLHRAVFLWHRILHRISFVGRLEDGASFDMDAACARRRQLDELRRILENAVECFNTSVYFPVFFLPRAFVYGADYGIKPRAISAAGDDKDFLHV